MKKRLIGGLVLLNLCSISLSIDGGEQDITNKDVLDQLTELRSFIDEKRDFSKDVKDLKPVVVQYRSSASKIDGIVECNMSFNTDALHLSIGGISTQSDGSTIRITINVVYQFTDYVGYTIKSAKINVVSFEDIISLDFTDMSDTEIVDYLQSLGKTEFYAFVKSYIYVSNKSFSGLARIKVAKPSITLSNFEIKLEYRTGDYGTTKGFYTDYYLTIPYDQYTLYDKTKNQYLTHDNTGDFKWLDITNE